MRKTIVLAFAIAAFAVVTVITDFIRVDAGINGKQAWANPVTQVQTSGANSVRMFDAI
jgi:hypothetical protein